MKSEEADNGGDDVSMPDVDQPPQAPVITRAGRQSKTATPLSSTFPEQLGARGRAARGNKDSGNNTGSHASSESGEQQRSRRKKGTATSGTNAGSAAPSTRADDASDLGDEAEIEDADLDEAELEGVDGEEEGNERGFGGTRATIQKKKNGRTTKKICQRSCQITFLYPRRV